LKGKNVLEGLRLGAGGAVWSPLGRSLKIKICSMGPAARFWVSSLMEKALFKHFQQAVPSFYVPCANRMPILPKPSDPNICSFH
jgi:hypothetical protein